MPRYIYHCEKCDNIFEYYHLMSEKKNECEICREQTLLKIPYFSGTIKKQFIEKPGSIVESFIEEAREEIKREKKQLITKDYKPE